jgi:hypothetical protein
MISVRGTLSHGGLRKGNPDSQVMTGFYRSPGIAGKRVWSEGMSEKRADTVGELQSMVFQQVS